MAKTKYSFLSFTLKSIVASVIAICVYSCHNDNDEEVRDTSNNYDGIVSCIGKDTIYLYEKNFIIEELGNWTNSENTTQTDGIFLKDIGNCIYLKNYYALNHRTARLYFTLSADTKFTFGTNGAEVLDRTDTNKLAPSMNRITFDAKNERITFENNTRDYQLKDSTLYEIALETNDRSYSFTLINITDKDTLEIGTFTGECNDLYGIYLDEGSSPCLKKFTVETDRSPYIVFCGNSITHGEGTTIENNKPVNAFSYLTGEETGKPYLLSAKGGSTIHQILGIEEGSTYKYTGRLYTEIIPLKPQYVMITIGSNGGNTTSNIGLLVRKLKENGITPILNNIPFRFQKYKGVWGETSILINNQLEQVRKQYDVIGANLNIATSMNKGGKAIDLDIYELDENTYVHPTDEGHRRMFEQVKEDCPMLFSN